MVNHETFSVNFPSRFPALFQKLELTNSSAFLRCRLFGRTRRNQQTRRQLLQIEFRLNEYSTKGYQKIFGENILGPKIFERSHFGRIFGRGSLKFLFFTCKFPKKPRRTAFL